MGNASDRIAALEAELLIWKGKSKTVAEINDTIGKAAKENAELRDLVEAANKDVEHWKGLYRAEVTARAESEEKMRKDVEAIKKVVTKHLESAK